MKKIILLAMIVLGLLICFSTISQSQVPPEWAQIKQLALDGQKTEQGPWIQAWRKESIGSLWLCCYHDEAKAIQWMKKWYEEAVELSITCTFWESGPSRGKFRVIHRRNSVETQNNYVSSEEGIKLGKQFINELQNIIKKKE